MNGWTKNAILRDIALVRGPGLTKHFRVIATRRGVTVADVRQVHEDERKRRAKAHDQRRRAAMQGVVLI